MVNKNFLGKRSGRYRLLIVVSVLMIILVTACNPITSTPSSSSPSPFTTPTITPPYTPTITTPPQTSYSPPSSYVEFTVVRIIDGDTIEVRLGSELYTVRYIGIDAPELDEPFGTEAMEKNLELVEGKMIRLVKDISETDQYSRLLGYIYADDMFVNAELVRLGYAQAVSYPPDTKHDNLFKDLETKAKDVNIGLWEINQSTKTTPNTTKITPPPRD
jgi:micrococcal nuclease